jgi:starch synthase
VNYDLNSLGKRPANKGLLQQRLGLPENPEIPLFGVVSRMDPQKGVDLAISALKSMKRTKFQAVLLGTGDPKLEESAVKLQEEFPQKIRVETRYDAGLARQIYAGADMLLMPSRYEPCGLSQMIAMRYGCIPIVRAAGGLNDTVRHRETGFVFEKAHHMSLKSAMRAALQMYESREKWAALQRAGMSEDFSWEVSAGKYLELYHSLIKR